MNHPAMLMIFDGGNIVMQGYSTQEIYEQYEAMKPGLGWFHIKDFANPRRSDKWGHVEEDKMKNFVPPDQGASGHERILRDLAPLLPSLEEKLKNRGIPGVFLDLEPHLYGSGCSAKLTN